MNLLLAYLGLLCLTSCMTSSHDLHSKSMGEVSTIMNQVSITKTEESKYLVSAHIEAGSNECLAKGVGVALKKEQRDGVLVLVPTKSKVPIKACNRIYRPVYKKASITLSEIIEVYLMNYKKLGAREPAESFRNLGREGS